MKMNQPCYPSSRSNHGSRQRILSPHRFYPTALPDEFAAGEESQPVTLCGGNDALIGGNASRDCWRTKHAPDATLQRAARTECRALLFKP